jgi:hypothetical protein
MVIIHMLISFWFKDQYASETKALRIHRECMSSGAHGTVLYKRRIQAAKVRLMKKVKQCARYNRMWIDEISV